MRQVGTIPDEALARRLSDYLLTQGITTRLEQGDQGWAVWVHDEDRLEQAGQELKAFLENPDDARYADAAKIASALRQRTAKSLVMPRRRLGRSDRRPVTFALAALSIVVTLSSDFGVPLGSIANDCLITSFVGDHGRITHLPQDLPEIFQKGEVWRLVTPIFIHFGVAHLIFNMLWLFDLGSQIERCLGSWRFGLTVLAIAIISNLVQFEAQGTGFGGMSGVVYGLFGYVWIKIRRDSDCDYFVHPTNIVLMIAWFFLCMTGTVGDVANWAHGAGLVLGILMGLLF
jgi:GlpG protein